MFKKITAILSVAVLLLMLSLSSFGQNTKGDTPQSGRESRFRKTDSKQKSKRFKKRNKPSSDLRSYKPRKRSRSGERAAAPVGRVRRLQPRSSSEQARNVYPQRGPYVNNPSKTPRRDKTVAKNPPRGKVRSKPPRRTDKAFRVKRYTIHNSSRKPDNKPRAISNRSQLAKLKKLQGPDSRPRQTSRVQPRTKSRAYVSHKTINIQARYPRPKRRGERATTRDISGRPLRTRNYRTPKQEIIKSQPGGRGLFSGQGRSRRGREGTYGRYKNFSSASGNANVYKRNGRNTSNPSQEPRSTERGVSNSGALSRLKRLQSKGEGPDRQTTVVPRSSSRSFQKRRSTNVWAHFPRPKRRSEQASTRDIAGHPLRKKNYQTPQQPVITPHYSPYYRRKRVGDVPYSGKTGGYISGTRAGRAWRGDIVNRRIRGIKDPRKVTRSGVPLGGYRSATKRGQRAGVPIPVRQPGIWGEVLRNATGKITGRRSIKGGGSASGGLWNNKGRSLAPRVPRRSTGAEIFQGNAKTGRPIKGGGSVSGKGWNNKGLPLNARIPGGSAARAGNFQGNIKVDPRKKGGGSVSGRLWNNGNTAIDGRRPSERARRVAGFPGKIRMFDQSPGFQNQGEEFTGTIKARRPAKGGGSVSGKVWNNGTSPLAGRELTNKAKLVAGYQGKIRKPGGSRDYNNQGEEFTGNIKARRPAKGGGSVSGKLWNNQSSPLAGRVVSRKAKRVAGYPGKIRMFDQSPAFQNQGEEFTGAIKAQRPAKGGGSVSGKLWNNDRLPIAVRPPGPDGMRMKGYQGNLKASKPLKGGGSVSGKIWNNHQTPIAVRTPGIAGRRMEGYQGTLKASRPVKGGGSVSGKLWNNDQAPIAVRTPKSGLEAGSFSGTIKLSRFKKDYKENPNASALALKKARPSKQVFQEGRVQTPTKRYQYVRNSSSADEALKTREPGRAFARAGDYQGNIRMRKFKLDKKPDLHPDAAFVKTNKNNVDDEKDAATNFKLWWARLFRKSETQPTHLKYKERKPRYDDGEQGLWYD